MGEWALKSSSAIMPKTNALDLAVYRARQIIDLSRPKNAVHPLLALLMGYAMARGDSDISSGLFITFAIIVLLNFFATLQNDAIDKPIDQASGRVTPLIRGEFSTPQVLTIAYCLAVTAVALPVLLGSGPITIFAIVYLFLAWCYNAPPWQASRRPLASLVILALLLTGLPLAFGYYLVAGTIPVEIIGLAFGGFWLRFANSILKDYKDYAGDKRYSKKTFLVAFGPRLTKRVSIIAAVVGYGVVLGIVTARIQHTWISYLSVIILGFVINYALWLRTRLRLTQRWFSVQNNEIFHRLLDVDIVFEVGIILCLYFF